MRGPWRRAPGGVVLAIRVTPKGGRDAVEGVGELADGTCVLKVRVRAAAAEGEANAALVRLVADTLRLPPRTVRVVAGAKSRIKQIEIAGAGEDVVARVERICVRPQDLSRS